MMLLLISSLAMTQDDSTSIKKSRFNGLGVTMGYSHALIRLESQSQFIPNTSRVLSSSPGNRGGITAGFYYEVKKKNLTLRPSIELSIIYGHVLFDVQRADKEEGYVLPFTVEFPFHFIYQFQKFKNISLVAGPRLALPFAAFESVQPPLKGFGLASDIAVSIPLKAKKTKARIEIGYSFGLNNLQDREEGNPYSTSITSLRRDLVFGKFYFN